MYSALHSIKRISIPHLLRQMAPYDVAITIHQSLMASCDVASTVHQSLDAGRAGDGTLAEGVLAG
jgi:hypothetical protein